MPGSQKSSVIVNTFPGALKAFAASAFPRTYTRAQMALARYRLARVRRFLVRTHGFVVLGGPFRGMEYESEAVGSSLVPKLVGSYEGELHDTLARIIATDYETVIDVGCAEGFYAVGLALRLPKTRVFAFDIDERARGLCRALAARNQVADRVAVAGECDRHRLQALIQGRVLIVCDCEGCELGLLDPERVPGLTTCDLLVELHDVFDTSITPTLMTRFSPTHEIDLITSSDRDPDAWPVLKGFSLAAQRTALGEYRGVPMQWAWMRAKKGTCRT